VVTLLLKSILSTAHGTFGEIILPNGTKFFTLELPWKDNKPEVSCIPAGVYLCKYINSPKHGPTYELSNVPGRTSIQIHKANFAGDISKGLKSDLLGCIALGTAISIVKNQLVILNSGMTIDVFEAALNKAPFYLKIERS
jgi:hypothetical protein